MTCPNISAEGAAPTSQPQTERCELEQAFGFQDSAFRDYMLTESAKSGSPHDLVDVAHSMDLAEHPVVMFGAGWALTEAATFRGNREDEYSTLSLGERLDSLQLAWGCWMAASNGFVEARRQASTLAERAQADAFALRSVRDLGTMGLLYVMARWRAGYHVPAPHVAKIAVASERRMYMLGHMMVDAEVPEAVEQASRVPFAQVLSSHLMLTDGYRRGHLVTGASLRRAYHPDPTLRSDLMVTSMFAHHPRTFVRIAQSPNMDSQAASPFYINARELTLPGESDTQPTLQAVLAGNTSEPGQEAIKAMSAQLHQRLKEYIIQRY